MEYQFFTLPNGLRVVHRESDSYAGHCGIFIDVGSRDEEEDENGIAHFIEHTIFKGTKRRKAYHILNRIESVGGDLNAYTTKEETCIYASFLKGHFDRVLELIADLIRNSVFPEKEISKEKDVILDEINSYRDSPGEEIYDLFEEHLFRGHPLGRNILGTEKNLRDFNREKVLQFIKRHYHPERMVISSVGPISFKKLQKLVLKYFEEMPYGNSRAERIALEKVHSFREERTKPIFQTHCVAGNKAYSRGDERKYAMYLLNNLLGGPAMNSRLNLLIREKHGYSYHIESNYHAYIDTGIFSIYLGTDNGYLDRSLGLVNKELRSLTRKPLGDMQLRMSKQQAKGQMALGYESNLNKMLAAGKSLLHDGEVMDLGEMHRKIDAITKGELMDAANEVLTPEKLSLLVYKSNEK
jgi:predicted Zn-dependent peptidase